MPLVTLDNGCLAFGHVALLDKAELQIDAGERIALIGRNGSGKSSLLRALANEATLDDGNLWRASGLKIAYVPQEPLFDGSARLFDVVASGMGAAANSLVAYHEAAHRVAHDPSETALAALQELQHQLEASDG